MILPTSIWFCEEHRSPTGDRHIDGVSRCFLALDEGLIIRDCRFIELRVAGPDDQLATKQIEKLAQFIMDEVPGEPSQSEGAVDTAIRLLRGLPGPDDLLIRREGMVERALAAYRSPHTQRIKRRAATPEDRMEAALLAAAEGEEE